jgi:hypothetical protein
LLVFREEARSVDYKGIEYSVVQTANGWKWIVFLDATKTRTGMARTRAHAILDAEHAIDMTLKAVAAEPTQLKIV